jgi:hypothetical protein
MKLLNSTELEHVVREVWTRDLMCSGLPTGTRFEWLTAHDRDYDFVASLRTSWLELTSFVRLCPTAGSIRDGRTLAEWFDARLSELRRQHWLAIYWPDIP